MLLRVPQQIQESEGRDANQLLPVRRMVDPVIVRPPGHDDSRAGLAAQLADSRVVRNGSLLPVLDLDQYVPGVRAVHHHVLPHDLLGHPVVGGQSQFREAAYLEVTGEVVLHRPKLEHDSGALLLRHMGKGGWLLSTYKQKVPGRKGRCLSSRELFTLKDCVIQLDQITSEVMSFK